MITGKSLHRMGWKARRLLRTSARDNWWGSDYESCPMGKTAGAQAELPDDLIPECRADKVVTNKIRFG
ncbi:MAG: hypothetical protein ABR999_00010 [Methanoregula sp.]|uniref:hypothetical protein n=1 Tax=Methanoregula sp. TaxID=2052170 RepID=UPI003D141482